MTLALPYLHDGAPCGAAGGVPTRRRPQLFTSNTLGKGLSLWNGSSNNAPPANWYTPGFNDSAWTALYDVQSGVTGSSAAASVWTSTVPQNGYEKILVRQHVTLPAEPLSCATIYVFCHGGSVHGVWINGTSLANSSETVVDIFQVPAVMLAVDVSLLNAGGDNMIAIEYDDNANAGPYPNDADGAFTLRVFTPAAGSPPLTYTSAVLADSPMAYWPLSEASGTTINDATGNGHTGTATSGLTYGVAGPPQVGGTALGFSGAQNIDVPASGAFPPAGSSTYTIEAWVQPNTIGGGMGLGATAGYGLLGYGTTTASRNSNEAFLSQIDNGFGWNGSFGVTNFWRNSAGASADAQCNLTATWHHVAFTWDGTTVTVYVDGAMLVQMARTSPAFVSTDVSIGSVPTQSIFWGGNLACVALYNYALSATQVQAHYDTAG